MSHTNMPSDSEPTADINAMPPRDSRPYHMSFNSVDRVGGDARHPRSRAAAVDSQSSSSDVHQSEQAHETRGRPTDNLRRPSRRGADNNDRPSTHRPHRHPDLSPIRPSRQGSYRPSNRDADRDDVRSTHPPHRHPELSPICPSRHDSHRPPRYVHDSDTNHLPSLHHPNHVRGLWTNTPSHPSPRQDDPTPQYGPAFVFDPRSSTMYHTQDYTHPGPYNQLVRGHGERGAPQQQQHHNHPGTHHMRCLYPVMRDDGFSLAHGQSRNYSSGRRSPRMQRRSARGWRL